MTLVERFINDEMCPDNITTTDAPLLPHGKLLTSKEYPACKSIVYQDIQYPDRIIVEGLENNEGYKQVRIWDGHNWLWLTDNL